MKFDSTSLPILPTFQQLTEIHDLLASNIELYQLYTTLERHGRIIESPKSLELFSTFTEQLRQDITVLDKQLEVLLTLSRPEAARSIGKSTTDTASFAYVGTPNEAAPYLPIPDVEPTDTNSSVFELVKKAFQNEDILNEQLTGCLRSAQQCKHLKLELQLKMIVLSSDQRYRLLEDRYGYAKTKNVLFQGLRRQTTRFLSALSGETRNDIDQ